MQACVIGSIRERASLAYTDLPFNTLYKIRMQIWKSVFLPGHIVQSYVRVDYTAFILLKCSRSSTKTLAELWEANFLVYITKPFDGTHVTGNYRNRLIKLY